jgi:DNA-binding SARP family transcriptional activator
MAEMLEFTELIPLAQVAEDAHHQALRRYLQAGTAERHLYELRQAAKELRQFLVVNFTAEELLDSASPFSFRDPDNLPGNF